MDRSNKNQLIASRIRDLRNELQKDQVSAYLVCSSDEYFSEFTPQHNARLEFITGFSGSNGLLLITMSHALFFTDGRYLEQARAEMNLEIFTILDQSNLKNIDWHKYLPKNHKISFNPKLFTKRRLEFLKIDAKPAAKDYIDAIWSDRPAAPAHEIYNYDMKYAGESAASKIVSIRSVINDKGADWFLICSPDSLSWLLNLRGSTDSCTPFANARALVGLSKILLFTDGKLNDAALKNLPEIEIYEEKELEKKIKNISKEQKILFDPTLTSYWHQNLQAQNMIAAQDPCQSAKMIKNISEIQTSINIHIKDCVALCESFAHLFQMVNDGKYINECGVDALLRENRARQGSLMNSFPAICGYGTNSAIIHYRAKKI